MLSRVIANNVGDVFFETQCICVQYKHTVQSNAEWLSNRTPAIFFSAYVYASHLFGGVLVRHIS